MRCLTSLLTLCALMSTLMLSPSGIAAAEHDGAPDGDNKDIPSLVAAVAEANQRVADVGADIQIKQEGVNKALVEIAAARDILADAQLPILMSH